MAAENNDNSSEQPTALMQRDALLGLIDQSAARELPRAHTVPRERLRSNAVTREELAVVDLAAPQQTPEAELDTDLSPPLSPLLVFAVVAVLIVTFIAVTRLS